MPIGEWLKGLGCERFADVFREHEISVDALQHLTESDLREIGIPLGPRRVMLAGISALAGRDKLPETRPAEHQPLRRQLSVIFCDLVGSTRMSVILDPEDMNDVIDTFRQCAAEVIQQHGGFVAKYVGDGVMAYFGYPTAQEDDAVRAVRACLEISRRTEQLRSHVELRTRTGVATGLVIVGDVKGTETDRELDVVGESPNLAARLQSLAGPSEVLIAESTQKLTGGLFTYGERREVQLKGFEGLTRIYDVTGESGVENRFEALRSNANPLIGRADEMSLLHQCWEQARSGSGLSFLISGEAGIGKSRILSTFSSEIQADEHFMLRFFCSPDHVASPYHPLISQLRTAARFSVDDPPERQMEKLTALIPDAKLASDRLMLLADLLSIPSDIEWSDPQVRKDRTNEALVQQIEDLAKRSPVVVVFEDAHWIDASSLELLPMLMKIVPRLPVMLVVTSRPEFTPRWQTAVNGHNTPCGPLGENVMHLGRLDEEANRELVETVAKGSGLPEKTLERIASRTDGVPLFIEEVTRAVVESLEANQLDPSAPPGDKSFNETIPVTLQDSLTARLDRLGPAVEVAQIGAVIGRQFDLSLLTAVSGGEVQQLLAKLEKLVNSQLVVLKQMDGETYYRFKHALVQDAAFSSLFRARRAELHGRVAIALERGKHSRSGYEPVVQAWHWARAGDVQRAIECYRDAADLALSRCAAADTYVLLGEALTQIALIEDETLRKRRLAEVELQRSQVFAMMHSVSSPKTGEALDRAHALASEIGDDELRMAALSQLWCFHMFTGFPRKARQGAQELLDVAQRAKKVGNELDLFTGHLAMALVEQDLGELQRSSQHFDAALDLVDAVPTDRIVVLGFNPGVIVRSFYACVLFQLGYPDRAFAMSRQGIAQAEILKHPLTTCMSLAMESIILFAIREANALETCGTTFRDLAIVHDLSFYPSISGLSIGAAEIMKTGDRKGLDLVKRALESAQQANYTYQAGILGCTYLESLLMLGDARDGLTYLDESLPKLEQTGEREFYPEQLRLKGEFLVLENRPEEAEDCFEAALEAARDQGAKMWELRAALCLARLYVARQETARAQALVRPIHDWFTEGFTLSELQEARALLADDDQGSRDFSSKSSLSR